MFLNPTYTLFLHTGFVGSAVSGAVPIPVVGDALGSITEDLIDRGAVNWRDVAKDASWGAAFGQLRKKIRRLLPSGSGRHCCTAFLTYSYTI